MHLFKVEAVTGNAHVLQARAQKRDMAAASDIDDALISALVDAFYVRVRSDAILGPIFAAHIADWAPHLARMKDFWASIMIESGRFSGSPMQKHIALGGLDEVHFAHWLGLWDATLTQLIPDQQVADRFRAAATRIGNSLLTGIQIQRGGLAAIARAPNGAGLPEQQT
jgi:hemoglobin